MFELERRIKDASVLDEPPAFIALLPIAARSFARAPCAIANHPSIVIRR
jgi:hypothetical protein